MGLQIFYGKGPHLLLWGGSRAVHKKITVSGIHKYINYCEIFMVYTQFTNVVAGRIKKCGWPKVGDP